MFQGLRHTRPPSAWGLLTAGPGDCSGYLPDYDTDYIIHSKHSDHSGFRGGTLEHGREVTIVTTALALLLHLIRRDQKLTAGPRDIKSAYDYSGYNHRSSLCARVLVYQGVRLVPNRRSCGQEHRGYTLSVNDLPLSAHFAACAQIPDSLDQRGLYGLGQLLEGRHDDGLHHLRRERGLRSYDHYGRKLEAHRRYGRAYCHGQLFDRLLHVPARTFSGSGK